MNGWSFVYNNDEYIRENYMDYDLLVSQEDDMLISQDGLDYYCKFQSLPQAYVPGFMYSEVWKGQAYILGMPLWPPLYDYKMTLDKNPFFDPHSKHSGLFMTDKNRYTLYLKNSGSVSPDKHYMPISEYSAGAQAKVDFYLNGGMEEVVSVSDVKSGAALIKHLPNTYISQEKYRMIPYVTPENISQFIT